MKNKIFGLCLILFSFLFLSFYHVMRKLKVGVCSGIENMDVVINSGADYLEPGVQSFLVPAEPESKFLDNLAKIKGKSISIYACNSFIPGSMKSVGQEACHDSILKFAETAFRRAKKSGIKVIVFGSGGSRKIPDGFSKEDAKKQFTDLLKKMAPLAKKYGIMVVIEPLNKGETNFINSLAEAAEISTLVHDDNIQILADFYHMMRENESADEIIKYGAYIRHCHIAEKEKRTPPGTMGDDFSSYFIALKKIDYKGRISIEANWDKFELQVKGAVAALQGIIQKN